MSSADGQYLGVKELCIHLATLVLDNPFIVTMDPAVPIRVIEQHQYNHSTSTEIQRVI